MCRAALCEMYRISRLIERWEIEAQESQCTYAQQQGANQFTNGVDFQLLDLSRSAMRSEHSNPEH